jgi:predicted transcriptional regulator
MNNKYTIRITHPLIRPGIIIETESSERYVIAVTLKLLELVRAIEEAETIRQNAKKVS